MPIGETPFPFPPSSDSELGLQVAKEKDWMSSPLGKVSFDKIQPDTLIEIITDTFGHHTDSKKMNYEYMFSGRHGIMRFYFSAITSILDSSDVDSPEYMPLMTIVADFCRALADKIVEYSRVSQDSTRLKERTHPTPF